MAMLPPSSSRTNKGVQSIEPIRRRHLAPCEDPRSRALSPRRFGTRPRSEIWSTTYTGSCENIPSISETKEVRRRKASFRKFFKSEINLLKTDSLSDLSERGAPEGQEDPALHTSFCSSVSTACALKRKLKPDMVAIKLWVQEKLRIPTPASFPIYVEGIKYVDDDIGSLQLPKKKENEKIHHRISLMPGETLKRFWNVLVLDSDDICYPSSFCVTTGTVYTLNPDGHVLNGIGLQDIDKIEISCNYFRIDIFSTQCQLKLLVPEQDLCLTIVSFIEYLRRSLPQVDLHVLPQEYAYMNHAHFDCFVLRDIDGGGAFQLDVSAETANGHLMYCRLHKEKSIKWISGYFVLRGRILQCYSSPNVPHPKWDIPLRETGMSVSLCSSANLRPNTIELWYQGKTVLILAAASVDEAQMWYGKLLRTLDALSPVKVHRALELQPKILVSTNTGISLMSWKDKMIYEEMSAKLEQIGAVRLDPELDSAFVVIDFECQEAGDSAGDWVIHFPSWNRMEEFLSSLKDTMPHTAEISYFEEGSYLLQRCRNVAQVLGFGSSDEV